jgi:hypothetical protein
MRLWLLAALPLFWSCADNLAEPQGQDPDLVRVEVPSEIVAGWADPLEIRAQAMTPDEEGWSLVMQVEALDFQEEYLLRDDGNFGSLDAPSPGQENLSGDNVAGDGWFTTRLSADFSPVLGPHTLRFSLRRNGVEVEFRQLTRDRVENRAPEILEVVAPSQLPSGASFTASLRAIDRDGQEDLLPAQLRQSGGVLRSWDFTQTGDSLWTLTVGPELAAGRQGPDTLEVVALDRVGHESVHTLVVDMDNSAPVLDTGAFELWLWDSVEEHFVPVVPVDTLRLQMPDSDAAFFHLALPISDAQTPVDLAWAQWSIARVTTPLDQVVWYEMDDLGPDHEAGDWVAADGLWSGAFQLPWDSPIAERVLRIRAQDQAGQLSGTAEWPVRQIPAAIPPRGGGLSEIGPGRPHAHRVERTMR